MTASIGADVKVGAIVVSRLDGRLGKAVDIDGETGLVVVQWTTAPGQSRWITYEDALDLAAASMFERVMRRLRLLLRE